MHNNKEELNSTELLLPESRSSGIKKFFKDKSILITGATGLVGKLLLYKLLLSFQIGKIFILMRSKRGVSVEERMRRFKNEGIFKFLPDLSVLSKIVAVNGDIGMDDLGMSKDDQMNIIENVSIVFHSAATIRFTAPLKESVKLNVNGTLSVIELCRRLNRLDAFIHISTAFCNPHHSLCEEIVYPSHVNPKNTLELVKLLNDHQISLITKHYIEPFPNTYTFTKNLSENLINEECHDMSIAIIRPSIVSSSLKEPVPGWVDSINGLSGGALLAAVGLARTVRMRLDGKIDLIPIDILANICIVAAYATATRFKSQIRVYNANASNFALSSYESQRMSYAISDKYPSSKAIRPPAKPQTKLSGNPIVHHMTKFFSEICFAYLCDSILYISGKKRIVVNYMRRFHKIAETIEFFGLQKWEYTNKNLNELNSFLDKDDSLDFNIEIHKIDWKIYYKDMYFGARKYLLNEKINVKRDRIRMNCLKLGYGFAYTLMYVFIGYMLISVVPYGKFVWKLF